MYGKDLHKAATFLIQNDAIAMPTETVYGLAANAYNTDAVKTIFTIKKRPLTSPLIVHTSSLSKARSFVKEIPPKAMQLADAFWPGPLTLLLEKKRIIPDLVTAGLPTVGVRVPNHPLTRALLEALPFPLAAPSANPFGYISPTTAQHVEEQLGSKIPYILDGGPCQVGLESTIIGFQQGNPVIYRFGSITQEEIEKVVGTVSYLQPNEKEKGAHLAPGRTKQHYAPHTPILVGDLHKLWTQHQGKRIVALCFDHPLAHILPSDQIVLSPKKSLKEAARHLFAALHQLDKKGADLIIAPLFPNKGLGYVINERLKRASSRNI